VARSQGVCVRTIVVLQEVDDVERWLASSRRHEVFGPLGIAARTFVDDARSGRVGLIVETPSLAAFEEAMRAPGAAVAMKADGVRPDTCIVLTER
jgi:hypothetical protein